MRVPINPATNVPHGQLGYERAVDVTAGTRMLADVIGKYAEEADRENKKRELFDVQKRLVDETNNIQTDFEAKTQAEKLGAPNFTQRIAGEYNTRHQQLVQDLKDRGYSEDAVNEFETRLGTIRAQYVARAIDFQEKSNYAKVLNDSDQMVTSLSQYASKNPFAVQSSLDEFQVALQHSGLDAIEQATVFNKGKAIILKGAQDGFATQHPEAVLGLFGLPNELKTVQNKTTGELINLGQAQQTVANGLSNFNPNVVAGFLGNFHVEGGYDGAQGDGGKAAGIAQWQGKRRDNFKNIIGKDPTQATIDEQVKFVLWEMENPLKAGMTVAQRDAILGAKTPKEAAELIDKYYERSSGKARADRVAAAMSFVGTHAATTAADLKPIPPGWKGNQEDAIQELGMTAEQAKTFIETGRDTRTSNIVQAAGVPVNREVPGIVFDANGKTGIEAIDLATPAEQMQMLVLARTIMNERNADVKAANKEEHDKFLNDLYNGIADGKYGQADITAAYQSGQLTDYDERAKAQSIFDAKNKKDDDLVRFHAMLQTGQKFNPYDKDAQKAVDAGFESAVKYAAKQGPNYTDPLTIGLRAWQRTGIVPSQLGIMLRGGLVGVDPKQVQAAANIAGNMLRENPNAFASVDGQSDIEHAAVNFNHYVYDLGMSPDQASNRIAQENDPKFKAKVKLTEPEQQDAFKQLRQEGVQASRAFNNARFENVEAQTEANQTYHELIVDNLTKGLDYGQAYAQANVQMKKIYSLNRNGFIAKYTPEARYPQIGGSWNYIYDDARETVKAETGHEPTAVGLMPIPGITDQDFRSGRAPRYKIIYNYEVNGQKIFSTVEGQFAPDVTAASAKAQSQDAGNFANRRRQAIATEQALKRRPGQTALTFSGVPH